MAEQLVNEFTVNRPIDEAWAVITDVERIAPCLPGAQLQEIEGDVYRGVVKVKLGSITPQFKGQASFDERDDAAHRAVLKAAGRDTGGRGNASAEITAQAESLSPTSTRVVVSTDLHITGKVAQFGRGIIGDVSKKLMEQFADNLNTMLDTDPVDASEASKSSTASEASTAGTASEASKSSTASDATPSGGNGAAGVSTAPNGDETGGAAEPGTDGAASSTTAAAPQVRKIEGPATEPVDLAGVAGPAVLKRLLPLVAGLLLLLVVLRRRRR